MEAAVGAKTERRRKELLERRTVAPIVQRKRDPTTTKIPFHTRPTVDQRGKTRRAKKTLTGLTKRKGISYSFLKLHAWHKTCIKACFFSSSIPRFFSYPFLKMPQEIHLFLFPFSLKGEKEKTRDEKFASFLPLPREQEVGQN